MSLDKNGDGLLTAAEMKEGLNKAGLKEIPPDLETILQGVDADGSGIIDYTEFLAATLDKRQYIQEDVCWSAFRLFDRNGDGQITKEELKVVLGQDDVNNIIGGEIGKEIEELMTSVDSDGNGTIDFKEFMAMMR